MTETQDFHLQTMQMFNASCLFSFKSILLCTPCQSIKRTACMLNFIYIVQSDIYDLKSVFRGPSTSLGVV